MRRVEVDVVVVGSGIAGLTFALRIVEGARVLLVTKKERAASSTNYARGGIAAVVGDDDEMRLHVEDTLVAGAGLCHTEVVERVVREGPARVRDLVEWGARFHRDGDRFSLGREGGHSRRRIVHAGDRTGRAIESALLAAAEQAGLRILEDHLAVDLVTDEGPEGPRCRGLLVLDERSGERIRIDAALVLLATGGCGRVYRHTTNPSIATGDGVAMAFRAGARIANMEFIQFHPTALYPTEDPAFLISEALRGEGAVLRRLDGSSFMGEYHPEASLAPRDIVARAVHAELVGSGDPHVVLDVSAIPSGALEERFPGAMDGCRARGIEPEADGIPVVPAAHYLCGGIRTDPAGRSSLPGLMAAGEVGSTGLHGANRLASNSLLEAVVVSHRAAEAAREGLATEGRWRAGGDPRATDRSPAGDPIRPAARLPAEAPLRELMWSHAGIVRSRARLERARERLEGDILPSLEDAREVRTPAEVEARNLAEVAWLVVRSALARRESRGLHWVTDHPWRDNEGHLADTILVHEEPS